MLLLSEKVVTAAGREVVEHTVAHGVLVQDVSHAVPLQCLTLTTATTGPFGTTTTLSDMLGNIVYANDGYANAGHRKCGDSYERYRQGTNGQKILTCA